MTTVDVRIQQVGTGDPLFLHNGMWGPATSVLHAFGRACQDGRIPSSKWNVAEINEVTTGAVVRQALDDITDWDWQQTRTAPTRNESRLSEIGCSTAQSTKFTPSRSSAPGQRRNLTVIRDSVGTWPDHETRGAGGAPARLGSLLC